ncbi:pentatricopeptide repeat-containing protein At5g48910-like [Syzygium oleosum]|uniref:pentatricopeptide repeat-containing protein At5g48910-like n=2 Tax=Syzygium oleosum TaxID=219896 RepID=UPI0024B8F3AA|nr:pentatricopeptide repeat-containing protein At5g48910-like [Syzygium oleosum]
MALAESDDDTTKLEALALFREMVRGGHVEPNGFTFPPVLKACARLGMVKEGRQVHGMVAKCGLDGDEFVLSNLVRMYVLCGVMEDAYVLFDERIVRSGGVGKKMNLRRQEGDVVLWNVMVDGYVRMGDLRAARELFDKMPQRSVVSWNG